VVWGVFGGVFEFKIGRCFGGGVGCVLGLSSIFSVAKYCAKVGRHLI